MVEFFKKLAADQVVELFDSPVQLEALTAFVDLFRRAFADQLMAAVGFLDHDGHELSRKIERNLIDLRAIEKDRMFAKLLVLQDGPVHQVLEAGLEMAVQVRERKHFVVIVQLARRSAFPE